MFTRIILSVAIILKCTCGWAQDPVNVLKNYRYDCVAVNGNVQEMSATEDSLTVAFKKGDTVVGKDSYKIMSRDATGPYNVIYVKMDASSLTLVTPSGKSPLRQPLFGVFVFRFEKEDGKVLVLHDGRLWLTEKEARDTYAKVWLPDEYFNTWYVSQRFLRFTQYPDFRDADELTVEKVALYWIRKLQEHKKKKLNTINGDVSGAEYGRDNLTKVLVNYRLSPMATPADFNNKLKQYHLKITPNNQLPPRQNRPTARRDTAAKTT